MKRFFQFFILFCCVLNAVPATINGWFSPYPAGFNVNLEDDATYTGAIESGSSAKVWNSEGYNDSTLVALVGVSGLDWYDAQNKIEVKVEVNLGEDKEWAYVSASEPYLKRPFALDFISCSPGDGGNNRTVTRLGYGTDGSETSTTVQLTPALNGGSYEAWADIVLYLPENKGNQALSASDYFCSLKITLLVNGQPYGSPWNFTFNGYIDDEPDMSYANIFFNIQPYPAATSLSVNELLVEQKEIVIGEYDYETQSFLTGGQTSGGNDDLTYDRQKDNSYYIFASASPEANTSGSKFKMYLNGNTSSDDNFTFEIVLESTFNEVTQNGGRWKKEIFDGTASTNSDGPFVEAGKLVESLSVTHGRGSNLVFRDYGTISIRYPGSAYTPEQLYKDFSPGVYSSNVYFHIVSKY